jgi:hypothetical protein
LQNICNNVTTTTLKTTTTTNGWWKNIIKNGDEYILLWEMEALEKLYNSIHNYVSDRVKYILTMELLKASPLKAATFPVSVVQDIRNIDEPWSFLFERSRQAGKLLAKVLLAQHAQKNVLMNRRDEEKQNNKTLKNINNQNKNDFNKEKNMEDNIDDFFDQKNDCVYDNDINNNNNKTSLFLKKSITESLRVSKYLPEILTSDNYNSKKNNNTKNNSNNNKDNNKNEINNKNLKKSVYEENLENFVEIYFNDFHTNGRPITLVGYGMGARVVFECLKILSKEENKLFSKGIIENAVFIGAPISDRRGPWTAVRDVVAGRVINCYSRNDMVLSWLYRFKSLDFGVAGIGPVTCLYEKNEKKDFLYHENETAIIDNVNNVADNNNDNNKNNNEKLIEKNEERTNKHLKFINKLLNKKNCIENIDVSDFIEYHCDYPKKLSLIMSLIGLE